MDQVKDSHVLVDINKGTMHLSLNRPESLNAFSPDMIASLKDALNKAKGDEDIRVVTISGKSEEHTSELQSRGHLVCRLLLEKKKNTNKDDCEAAYGHRQRTWHVQCEY